MNGETEDRLNGMEREIRAMRRQLRSQRMLSVAAVAGLGLMTMMGAAPREVTDGHFNRIFARSINIANEAGKTVAQLDAVDGGGSLLLRNPQDRQAVHLIAGASRNEMIVYDRRGDIALVAQGVADEGRLSLHKTFDNYAAAEAALPPDAQIKSALVDPKTSHATIPILRLPEASR